PIEILSKPTRFQRQRKRESSVGSHRDWASGLKLAVFVDHSETRCTPIDTRQRIRYHAADRFGHKLAIWRPEDRRTRANRDRRRSGVHDPDERRRRRIRVAGLVDSAN